MHYHLIGICGTAMAALAGMLQARGHRVTGSDENVYPPMSTMLASLGIEVMQGYRAEHLEPAPDCVIVGNAIPRGNAEVEATLDRKLLYRSQAEVVKEEFIRGRRSLVVAGTHGKTTTTSIAAWVMDQGGLDPTFLIGGVAQNFGVSFRVTDSDYFIIEGDEYDTAYFDKGPKFMHYLPEIAIVNNIEFDHADIYQRSGRGETCVSPAHESRSRQWEIDCRLGQPARARRRGVDGPETVHSTGNFRDN